MKKKIFVSIALLALLAACDDHYDDQFNIKPDITDVKDIAMTLETADYGTISKLSANQELALSKDPEGKTYVEALAEVGTNHYFTEEAPAEDYLPAYLKSKYPNADEGSRFVVTYKLFSPSEYMGDFKNLSAYDLTEDDYKTVWGDKVKASFLSPSTVSKIPGLLKAAVNNPAAGDMKVVNYAYSQTEPSIGGGGDGGDEPAPSYTSVADLLKLTSKGEYTSKGEVVAVNAKSFILKDETGLIRVYQGKLVTCSVGDVVEVSGEVELAKQGMNRFSSKSVFKVLERKEAFTYPDPQTMETADLVTYANAAVPAIQYVTYEGTLTKNSNNINIVLDGDNLVQGSITDALLVDDSWINQTVVVTGYLAGVSGSSAKYINTFATSIVVKGTANQVTPIGLIAYSPIGNYTVKGLVTAVHTKGFVMTDGTGDILVYKNALPDEKVGDMVQVVGTTEARNGLIQFTSTGLAVTSISEGSTIPNDMVPQVLSAAELNAYAAAPRFAYVSVEGTLTIEDSEKGYNYYNLAVEGVEKDLSLSYVDDSDVAASLNGKKVVMNGYLLGANKGGYIQVMLVSIKEAAAVAGLRSLASTRASSVSPTTSALYVYDGDNNAWKEYTTEEAKVAVVEPGVYESLGTDMIEEPETVLPTYLKQKYPYAAAESVVAVIYNEKANTPVVAEYTLGENWIETTSSRLVTTTFTQDAEGISAEASMYVNETFKKDLGSFTIQDVFMDGVSWVWKQDSYGYMKASAYIKATGNHQAESWLVSPVMNFKKSKEPELLFEHACRFRAENPADHLNVMVSVDYSGDVKTATWTALTVENWSDATDWTFVSNKIDLSAYNGQQVTIAFKYASTNEVAPTWEVKNVVVREKVEGESEGEEGGDAETPAE